MIANHLTNNAYMPVKFPLGSFQTEEVQVIITLEQKIDDADSVKVAGIIGDALAEAGYQLGLNFTITSVIRFGKQRFVSIAIQDVTVSFPSSSPPSLPQMLVLQKLL